MAAPPDQEESSIGELVRKLVENGRDAAQAEIALWRAIAAYRIRKAITGVVALGAALVLVLGAVTTLMVMVAIALARFIGPAGAGIAVAGLALIGGFLLMRFGVARVAVLGGDDEERRALGRGETRA